MNIFPAIRSQNGKYFRLGSLLLMMIFTVCFLAMMWTAVNCFTKISIGYESSSEGLAAAQFIANHIKRADGSITITCGSSGDFSEMNIRRSDGYINRIVFSNGELSEALAAESAAGSCGEGIFEISEVYLSPAEADSSLIKITVKSRGGSECTVYAASCEEIIFCSDNGGAA